MPFSSLFFLCISIFFWNVLFQPLSANLFIYLNKLIALALDLTILFQKKKLVFVIGSYIYLN